LSGELPSSTGTPAFIWPDSMFLIIVLLKGDMVPRTRPSVAISMVVHFSNTCYKLGSD
jgi:hypothetical protein